MKLRWTGPALKDLDQIRRFIAEDNIRAARRWTQQLRARARKVADMPYSGRIVPEVGSEDIREIIEGNYRIIYQVTEKAIVVLTVLEGHRLLRLDVPSK